MRQRLSEFLNDMATGPASDRITIRDLIGELGPDARAIMIFLLGILNLIPAPPGTSAITGIPLVILTWRLARGKALTLPAKISAQSVARSSLRAANARILPALITIERILRPRLIRLADPALSRMAGWIMLALSVLIFLPLPLVNMLPAMAVALMALGMLERDGLLVAFGAGFGLVSVGLVAGLYWRLATALLTLSP